MEILKKIPVWGFVLGAIAILALWVMGVYNDLVTLDGTVTQSWAQVETQYQRRMDLVPQLVGTVKGAANFEKSTLLEVTEARTKWLSTQSNPSATLNDQVAASKTFDSAMSRLLVSVEAYPALTATDTFKTLQTQLEGTENRISVARQDYNDVVARYNIARRTFPTVLVAWFLHFDERPSFESAQGAETAPDVNFDFNADSSSSSSNASSAPANTGVVAPSSSATETVPAL